MSGPTFDSVNVVIVDDEPFSLQTVVRTVEKLGSNVVLTAANGKEALEKLKDVETAVHIIICDIEMPEMGGFEFARLLRHGDLPPRTIPLFKLDRTPLEGRSDPAVAPK